MKTIYARVGITTPANHLMLFGTWALQISAAAIYLVLAAQPDVWRPLFVKQPADSVYLVTMLVFFSALWPLSLLAERRWFYSRVKSRLYRRSGLLAHSVILLFASIGAWSRPGYVALLLLVAMLFLGATVSWSAWMKTQRLPSDEQAAVDAVLGSEAQQAAILYYDRQTTPGAAPVVGQPAWKIPDHRHSPLVYFMRNGNRVKIGTTTHLKQRIRRLALRPENVVLLLDGGQHLERELHSRFDGQRVGNTEWFTYQDAIFDYITTENVRALREGEMK